jgi:chromosome partitioning protein
MFISGAFRALIRTAAARSTRAPHTGPEFRQSKDDTSARRANQNQSGFHEINAAPTERGMNQEDLTGVRVITVANEKGGSGKSTVAIHLAVALLRAGQRVATIDLDTRQRTFSRYIENRLAWAGESGKELPVSSHTCFEDDAEVASAESHAALAAKIESLAADHDAIIIDTPGHNHHLMRFAHVAADVLITPLNDSFVDVDVLGSVDPTSFGVTGLSHYAQIVEEARRERQLAGKPDIDWIVLRNRAEASLPLHRRLCRARHFPGVFPARIDGHR